MSQIPLMLYKFFYSIIMDEGPRAGRPCYELKAEAEALKGAARLEDLHLWQMEKTKSTNKGRQSYFYWMASWREGGKVRHVHLGSCRKIDHEAALQKARRMKREALGLSPIV